MNKVQIAHLSQVSFRYIEGINIISGLTFTLYPGQFYFVEGKSGMGKTTLLNLIHGQLAPSQGEIRVFGRDIQTCAHNELMLIRQNMGFIFQDSRLLDTLTALDNVAMMLYLQGHSLKRARDLAGEMLDWAGLKYHHYLYPAQLSVGQRQRVAIARAAIHKPLLLLADEPTGNLDDHNALRMMDLFLALHQRGTAILCVTHNQSILRHFAFPRIVLTNDSIQLRAG